MADINWESVPGFWNRDAEGSLAETEISIVAKIGLRTVGPVDSVETGCIKLEMYDGALPLRDQ